MLKNDLKQIKQIVDKSLDEKLDEKFKENNKNLVTKDDLKENNKNLVTKNDLRISEKNILEKIEESAESVGIITNGYFIELEGKMNKRFDGIDDRFDGIDENLKEINTKLKTKTSLYDLEDWKFDQRFKEDINALKYVNIDKLKNLPSACKINNALIKEGIK